MVESYFGTRLHFVPKHIDFRERYFSKIKCCAMSWNAKHISNTYKDYWGESGDCIEYRQNWFSNVHNTVFEQNPICNYRETRGRKRRKIA